MLTMNIGHHISATQVLCGELSVSIFSPLENSTLALLER